MTKILSEEHPAEIYKAALDIYKEVHNAVNLRKACQTVYNNLKRIITIDRLFCIIEMKPFRKGPPIIHRAAYIEVGKGHELPPRQLNSNELLTQIFAYGAILVSENRPGKIRELSPELHDMECWMVTPLISSTNVLGGLGFCRKEPGVFSELERDILIKITDAIVQLIIRQETIRRIRFIELERVANELGRSAFHEIINRFGTIRVYVEMIEEALKCSNVQYPQEIDQFLDNIHNDAVEIVSTTIERQQAIKKPLSKPSTELIIIADLIDRILQSTTDINQYKISKMFQSNELKVESYRRNLEDVFRDIIRNALYAMNGTNKKKLSIFLESLQDEHEKLWVRIKIEDTGCGIASRDLEKIWELSYSTKSHTGGFGLYWAKNVIEESNGTIEVQSQINRGTTLVIKLPAII